jgi:hypothetical protein
MYQTVHGDYRLGVAAEGKKITDDVTLFTSTEYPDFQYVIYTDPATESETLYRVQEFGTENQDTYTVLYKFDQTTGTWKAESALSGGVDQISGDSTLFRIAGTAELGVDPVAGEYLGVGPFLEEVGTLSQLGPALTDVPATVPDLPTEATANEQWAQNNFGDWRIGAAQFEEHVGPGVSVYSVEGFPDVKFLRIQEPGGGVAFLQMNQTTSPGNLPQVELSIATREGYVDFGEFNGTIQEFMSVELETAVGSNGLLEDFGGQIGIELEAWLDSANLDILDAGIMGFLRAAAFSDFLP